MSSLLVFNRVYRPEIQSVMLVFSTQLCELLPLYNLLSGSPAPPLPKVNVQYNTDSVWLVGGLGRWVVLETIFCRSLILCLWPDSEPTKLLYHPKQNPRRGGGLRQMNTCRNYRSIFYIATFGIAFHQSNLSPRGPHGEGPRKYTPTTIYFNRLEAELLCLQ